MLCNDPPSLKRKESGASQAIPRKVRLLVAAEKGRSAIMPPTTLASPRVDMNQLRVTICSARDPSRSCRRPPHLQSGRLERLLDRLHAAIDCTRRGRRNRRGGDSVHSGSRLPAKACEVIAFCRRDARMSAVISSIISQRGLHFLGMQGMIDPPREEAIAAEAKCQPRESA